MAGRSSHALIILVLVVYQSRASSQETYPLTEMARQDVLEILINNSSYNPRIAPDYEQDHATVVDVQIYVNSIDTVDEQSMDYSMNIYLRQRWTDPRLSFVNYSKASLMELDAKFMSQVWVPDTFFRNEKKAAFHVVTVPNRLMHLYRNGTIYYSMRLSVLLSCQMRLQKFPLDVQKCPVKLASYGYTTENIVYRWLEHKPIDFVENLQLSQHTLEAYSLGNCTKTYKETGSFSCVQADFVLQRDAGYFIIQVYVPGVLIVILSWVSFWLDVEAIPARISLGVLTVLTMTTQSSGARSSLPRVSYIKAIDVWMAACLFFVFAALLEFAYINVMTRRRFPYQCLGGRASYENSLRENESIRMGSDPEKGGSQQELRQTSKKSRLYGKQGARYIDKVARILFPSVFIIFNLSYWLIYGLVDIMSNVIFIERYYMAQMLGQ